MAELTAADVFDERALHERLTGGLQEPGREVVFLVGAALSSPCAAFPHGVPDVAGVIEIIAQNFDGEQLKEFNDTIAGTANPYQAAFLFLQARRGQQAVNGVIRKAVIQARIVPASASGPQYQISGSTSEEICQLFDEEWAGWRLTPATKALGELAAGWSDHFGKIILTTNFDPFISVAIKTAGGSFFRTPLHRDGNITQTVGSGSHIVHPHGYWHGTDTLHTPRQLMQERPRLRASLATLLRNKTIVVMGYGGWDDIFTKALIDVVIDDNAYPEIIWTLFEDTPEIRPGLLELLEPGIDRGRVTLYGGINCHEFLPTLVESWRKVRTPAVSPLPVPEIAKVQEFAVEEGPKSAATTRLEQTRRLKKMLSGEEDRPPEIDCYVGRKDELNALVSSLPKVGFLTGIGGQGKSALAGSYFNSPTVAENFDHMLWRDCKEQNFRFEDHLIAIIGALGDDSVSPLDLVDRT